MKTHFVAAKQGLMIFRKWSNKSYAVFNSLSRTIKVCTLLVIYSIVSLPTGILAQTQDTLFIDEVEISASRVPLLYSESSRVITVIGKEEIENAPVQSITELLEYALNVDVRQYGNHGVLADVSIRGGSFDQTLILLNGVKVSDPQTGHHNMNLPIDLENVKRIEILEGPGSRIYGPNAFSGAINIITGNEKEKNVTISMAGGEHYLYNGSVQGTFNTKQMENYLSVSRKASSGYIENTDFKISNMFYQTAFKSNLGDIRFQTGYNRKAFGANKFYQIKYPNQFEQTKTTFANVSFQSGKRIKYNQNIYWRRHQDKYIFLREDPSVYTNNHLTNVYGADFNLSFISMFGKTAIGSEYRSENILSNVLGESLNDTIPVPGEIDWVFTHGTSRENFGIFAEHAYNGKNISVSAGFLANWTSDYNWSYYPGIDASYQLFKDFRVFASVNKSLRLPTFTDLYMTGLNVGNPDLVPGEALTYEAGIKYYNKYVNTHFSVFKREGNNVIDWVKDTATGRWNCVNIPELNTTGFEIGEKISTKTLFGKNFPLSYINISYSYIKVEELDETFISKYALDYLKHKISVSTQHKIYRNFFATWRISYQDRAGTYSFIDENEIDKEYDYKPFTLVDTRVIFKKDFINAYVEASNIFDIEYHDLGYLVMPGRWIRVGVVFDIDINSDK